MKLKQTAATALISAYVVKLRHSGQPDLDELKLFIHEPES